MYDYIIAGSGCAGLSLAYRISQGPLKSKKVLIIDQAQKNENDRTWSYWSKEKDLFDPVVLKRWNKIWFHSPEYSEQIPISPYQYKTIRGIDFYDFVYQALGKFPNIYFHQGKIESLGEDEVGPFVKTDTNNTFRAELIFNSLPPLAQATPPGHHFLKQHFKGWIIETNEDSFEEETVTFMDFRIDQKGQTRFFYILPYHPRKALVEFTIFSRDYLEQTEYDQELKQYIQDFLKLDSYQILEEEFGMIPMADFLPPVQGEVQNSIIPIGIPSGMAKASTGYTFTNIQKQSEKLLMYLLERDKGIWKERRKPRFALYDSMLLNVMDQNRYPSWKIFATMFQKHPVQRIFRFLDEQSHFGEELLIMGYMYPIPFLMALQDILRQRTGTYLRLPKKIFK